MKIEIRPHKLTDAKRFFEIINDKEFLEYGKTIGMNMKVGSVAEERKFLAQSGIEMKKGLTCGYTILADGEIAGSIGIKISQHRKHIGEIGYFLDRGYSGKGVMPVALEQINKTGFNEFKLKRLEVVINPVNKRSIRVAEKTGYRYEGRMQNAILDRNGKLYEAKLFSKISSA